MGIFKKLGIFLKDKGLALLGDFAINNPIGFVLDSLGVADKSEEELIDIFKDEEMFLKLKELEKKYEVELLRLQNEKIISEKEIEFKNNDVVVDDLTSARKMMTDTLNGNNVPLFQKLMPSFVAFIVLLSTFCSFYLVFTIALPNENRDLIMMIVVVLLSKFSDLIGFYFGSSDYLNQSGKSYLGGVKKW